MDLLEFIFRLGVVFAIYGFIWWLIETGITLLASGRKRHLAEFYIIKAVKYFFLVDVTFLISSEDLEFDAFSSNNQIILGGIIVLMYFVGKLQSSQNRQVLFQMMAGGNMINKSNQFNLKAEIAVISFALAFFGCLFFYPALASNPISNWFTETIIDIEGAPIFGFIFKVIGFFFLMGIIMKMVNAILFMITGKPMTQTYRGGGMFNQQQEEESSLEDDFDDYEEVNDKDLE